MEDCGSKKSKLIKEQEVSGLLGNFLGTSLPVLGDWPFKNILFQRY